MTLLKAAGVDAFVAKPDPARAIVVLFGPDAGLVSERAEALVRASVDDTNDPMATVRLAGDDLAADPARLADEALAIPMFGGRRAIWVRAGARSFTAALEGLLAGGLLRETRVVIEAGDLRKTAPLRALAEKNPAITAIACYADTGRDLDRLIDEEMRAAGLSLEPDARAALLALLGGDRRMSRAEIVKLATFAQGQKNVSLDDVSAVVGDSSAWALDQLVDAAFAGKPRDVENLFGKALDGGSAAGTILFALARQCAQLHRMRIAVEGGVRVDEAIGPQIFAKRRPAWETALRNWSAPRLAKLMSDVAEVAFAARLSPALAVASAHRTLLQIASARK